MKTHNNYSLSFKYYSIGGIYKYYVFQNSSVSLVVKVA